MKKKILIAGSGFSGMWAALSAARAVSLAERENEVCITVVSPSPNLHIRPRFYETAFNEMAPNIASLLAEVGVKHFSGRVESVNTNAHEVMLKSSNEVLSNHLYDRFILATGSSLYFPDIPGLAEHSFNVDQLQNAIELDKHLKQLAGHPNTIRRNTVVVVGGGFTGIETVLEIPQRLRAIFGNGAETRVVLIEKDLEVGADLGTESRPLIREAFDECGVEVITSTEVKSITKDAIVTGSGERIETNTVIWTGGPRAQSLAEQIDGEHDCFGRVRADQYLRAKDVKHVFVTGDVVMVPSDDKGNIALMSCQHALSLGRVAGHNAAAELVGLPMHSYSQPKYVTCLDLGPWGALYTEGWDRILQMHGKEAKELKRTINTQWIYPPEADREAVFEVASPDYVIVP
jgi:NADH:ubiquinone reductase (H+-translocating)